MSGERIAREVVVTGRVQGVFFRDSMRREARRLGIAGWVRNQPDGTVQAHIEGPPDAVEALVRWSREGPRHASVDDVHVAEVQAAGCAGFDVH